MFLYSTYETTPEVAGHMLLFAAGVLGTDANQALPMLQYQWTDQVVAFRMLARTNADMRVWTESCCRRRTVFVKMPDYYLSKQRPVIADQIPKPTRYAFQELAE